MEASTVRTNPKKSAKESDDSMKFGRIELILIKHNKEVCFLVTPYTSLYLAEYGLYEVKNADGDMHFMDKWVIDLTSSLSHVFSQEDVIQQVVEAIKSLGVSSAEDLKYLEADDLVRILKPIEIRKVMACIK
ncbi:hypothetical protein QTP86_015092 [Hemibagrus guttatus]|nr:hypothetical protein QTP86_015092 [Hemibagrus guttatus]